MIKTMLLIGMGGFIGSVARYGTYLLALRFFGEGFPWGTLIANITGSLLIGVIYGVVGKNADLNQQVVLFLVTGILGGYTTFSTFAYENAGYLQAGNYQSFLLYSFLSFATCIAAALAGLYLVK